MKKSAGRGDHMPENGISINQYKTKNKYI